MRGVLLDVYNTMGPLLKEEYYRDAIVIGLEKRRIKNEPEKDFEVYYDGDARDFFMSGAELVARSQVDLEKTY